MKIFLSHKSRDKQTVECFRERLPEFLRSSAWLDVNSISWSDSIEAKLRDAIAADVDFLIPFIACDTLTSEWVQRELRWAFQREEELGRKFVLPIILEADARNTLPTELASRLHLTLRSFANEDIEHLAKQATLKLFELVASNYATADSATRLRLALHQAMRERYDLTHQRSLWTRPLLRLPLQPKITKLLRETMVAARRAALKLLRNETAPVEPKYVRTAIFFPSSKRAQEGVACTLTIPDVGSTPPKKLQLHLSNEESRISFSPNEGAVGSVFVRKQAEGVSIPLKWLMATEQERSSMNRWVPAPLSPTAVIDETSPVLEGESGVADFDMQSYQDKLADTDLTWIISMPIFRVVEIRQEVVGAFNVDGVKKPIGRALQRRIFYAIVPYAGVISGIVQELPIDRIAILMLPGGDQ